MLKQLPAPPDSVDDTVVRRARLDCYDERDSILREAHTDACGIVSDARAVASQIVEDARRTTENAINRGFQSAFSLGIDALADYWLSMADIGDRVAKKAGAALVARWTEMVATPEAAATMVSLLMRTESLDHREHAIYLTVTEDLREQFAETVDILSRAGIHVTLAQPLADTVCGVDLRISHGIHEWHFGGADIAEALLNATFSEATAALVSTNALKRATAHALRQLAETLYVPTETR